MWHGSSLRSAKEDEPKDASEKQREAWVDHNGPENFLVECKSHEDTVGNHRKTDTHEKADKP
jgi:hypothetical protein